MKETENTQIEEVKEEINQVIEEVADSSPEVNVDDLKKDLFGQIRKNVKNLTGVSYESGEDPFKFLERALADASKRQESELKGILETTVKSKSEEVQELTAKLQELQDTAQREKRDLSIKSTIDSFGINTGNQRLNSIVEKDLLTYFNDNVEEKDGHFIYKGEIVTTEKGVAKDLKSAVAEVLKNKIEEYDVIKEKEDKKLPSKAKAQKTLQDRKQSAYEEIRKNRLSPISYEAGLIYKKYNLTKGEVPTAVAVDYPHLFS